MTMVDLNNLARPAEDVIKDAKEYIGLKEDQIKLKTAKVASTSIARVLSAILVLNVALIVLFLLSITLIFLLGDLIGNYTAGAAIVTGFFFVLFLVLLLLRKKLFVSGFVKLFITLLYGEPKGEE